MYAHAPKSSSESRLATIIENANPEKRLPILTTKAMKPVIRSLVRLANCPPLRDENPDIMDDVDYMC
jgi:hypothetical protein